jgi:hypothetical protein
MEILAIIDVAQDADMEAIRAELPNELKGSWDLFANGVLREAYLTEKPTRVVFVLEAHDRAAAEAHLRTLPLVASGAMQVRTMELRPFTNWSKMLG